MAWQYTPYTIPLLLAGIVSGLLALYIWGSRRPPESRTMALLMLAVATWSLAYAIQLASATLQAQVFWSRVQYFGIVAVPGIWMAFSLQYTGRGKPLTRRVLALLSIEPLTTLILAWTNNFHGLIWSQYRLENLGSYAVKVSIHGSWFWAHTAYSYALLLLGTILIVNMLVKSRSLFLGQALALLIFAMAPWIGNMLYVFRLNPFPHLDLTPLAFTLTAPVMAWGLFRYRLGDLLPVAHAAVIESMNDGVIVLDAKNRILDLNPAAQRLADQPVSRIIGQPIDRVISNFAEQMDLFWNEIAVDKEIVLDKKDLRHIYDARLSPLLDPRGRLTSKVIALRDVTERKKTEEELQRHREQLEEMVRERTAELTEANERLLQEIADRQRIEEMLRLSEERHRQILDTSHDRIVVVDNHARILFANRVWQESTGFRPDEVNGLDMVHPDDREAVASGFQKALTGESMRNIEYRCITKSGEFSWVEANADIIKWPGVDRAILVVKRDINERKRMGEELRLSEERYRQILDSSHDVITVFDENLQLVYANKALYEESGYTLEEINNLKIYQLRHPDDLEQFREAFPKLMSGEPVRNFAFRRINKNGGIQWVESNMEPVRWTGTQKAFVSVARDVTESKRAQRALKESEERYRTLVDNSLTGIFVSQDEKLQFVNKRVCEIIGYTRDELTGMQFERLIHPLDRELVRGIIAGRYSGHDLAEHYEYRVIDRSGNVVWLESFGTLIPFQGRPAILVNVIDITARKQAEKDLRLSEERYHRILDSSKDRIFVMDSNAKIQYANRGWNEYTGYKMDEINAMDIFDTIHEKYRETVRNSFQKAIAGEAVDSIEYIGIHKSGENRWLEASAAPIDWPGVERAIVCIVRNITDRKRAEEALRESEERYRTLVDSSLTGIYLAQDSVIRFVNDRFLEMSEYTREELVGTSVVNLIHPDDLEYALQIRKGWLSGDDTTGCHRLRALTKSGKVRWAEMLGTKVDYQGKPTVMANIIDITEQRRMEEALREEKEKARKYLDIAGVILVAIDANEKVVLINRRGCEVLGYPEEQILGKNWFDEFLPDDIREETRNAFHELMAGEFEFARHFENPVLTVTGKERLVSWRNTPFTDETGNILSILASGEDITDTKRAEEALRASEERYRRIFWESPDIFFTLDLETWIVTDANRYSLEVLEYGPEMLGKIHVSDIVHPDDYEMASKRLRDIMVMDKDRVPNFPLRLLTRSGNVIHIEQSGVVFCDEEGHAKRFLGLARDVTERKKQEEMIQKRNERLSALYEVAKAANESLDLKRLMDVIKEIVSRVTNSDAMAIMSLDEAAQTFEYLTYSGIPEEIVREMENIRSDEGYLGLITKNRKPLLLKRTNESPPLPGGKSVERLGIESTILIPLIVNNKIIGAMMAARKPGNPYTDEDLELVAGMGSQIAVAIQNAKLYSQILKREAYLNSILETSRDGIVVTAGVGGVVYRNSAISSMFGYSDDDDLSAIDTTEYFAPESQPVLHWMREELDSGEQLDEIIEFKGKRKDGSMFDAELRLGYFFENGQRYDVGVVRDVTEHKRMEFQLLQSSKLAAIGQLAAGVAHEINNPVATIDVYTGLLKDIVNETRPEHDPAFLDPVQKYLNIIEDQVHRCRSVTGDLLSFSRVPEQNEDVFDINDLVMKTVTMMEHLTDKKPQIELALDEQVPPFRGDANKLQQVFVNLMNNAFKAIDPRGMIAVITSLDETGNIHVKFRDSGTGISKEIRDRIFDPFFTTRPEGTGLGLSISYYLIKQMNGTIDVESTPGQGTTFTITLGRESRTVEETHHAF